MGYLELPGRVWKSFSGQTYHAAVYFYFLFFVYFIVSAIVLQLFMMEFGFGDAKHTWLDFDRYLQHQAKRPYVYRVLSPWTINTLTRMVPDAVRKRIERAASPDEKSGLALKIKEVKTIYNWRDDRLIERIVGHVFLFCNLFCILLLLRHITKRVYDFSPLFNDFAPVVALPFLAFSFLNSGFMYDFPEIALALACFALALRGNCWFLYYPAFALACLNKETGVLIVIYFLALQAGRMPLKRLAAHGALHIAVGGTIVFSIRAAFAGFPGSPVEFHLWENLHFFSSPATYVQFTDNYALLIPVPRSYNLLNLALIVPLVCIGWKEKPHRIRTLFLAMLAVLTPLYIVWGVIDEIRVFYLTLPALYLLCIHTIHRCAFTYRAGLSSVDSPV